ncbi:MAG: protease modulator HflC [Rickettsiaceae bacterium]
MHRLHYILIGLILLAGLFISLSCFVVNQKQYVVVFQFGEAMRTIKNPGLYFKIPFIQNTVFFDKRILHVDAEAKELTASDGKRIIVNTFAKFIISEPVIFYKTVNNDHGVKVRLNRILESSMRKVIGKVPLTALLDKKRTKIMSDTLRKVNEETENFGIKVVDVRILRADLPKENSAAIYKRMQTEREKEAKQIRAEGEEEAVRVRSRADKESEILVANGHMQAEIIKGDGDAESIQIYNEAYSQDQEFYKFYKSLSVYQNIFDSDNSSFVLSTQSEFLRYLNIK